MRPHLVGPVILGGGGHPQALSPIPAARRTVSPLTVRPVFLTSLEASVLLAVLGKSDMSAAHELAQTIATQWSRPGHPSTQDDCDPHGIPRPVTT